MAAYHQVDSEWMSEVFLCKWWELILASVSEFERKYYDGWIQECQIQDGRIQDSCHQQVKWEWMTLSHIELVWVRVRVEWECFEWMCEKITRCQNPRWQCLNPTWQNSRWLPLSSWVRMNEWSFLCKWWKPILTSVSDFQRTYYDGWIQDCQIQESGIQDGCHHQVQLKWMSEVFLYKWWEPILAGVSLFERKD